MSKEESIQLESSEPKLSIAETLLYSCMKLLPTINGVPNGSSGTGFFYTFIPSEGVSVPSIVTNKHVLEGSNGVFVIFHVGKKDQPTGTLVKYQIDFDKLPLISHPNCDVDLVAILIGPILEHAHRRGDDIFYPGLAESNIPTDWTEFDALEELTMVGCPRGIIDEHNNLPIFRKGYSSTHISKNYNGRPEFLIDMACFPGSSGSPVFVFNQFGYASAKEKAIVMGSRFYFVGVLYAGPLIQNDGTIILGEHPKVAVNAMMHLGQVVRSTSLKDMNEQIRDLL